MKRFNRLLCAATLQDLVSGQYSSTEEAMRQLTQKLNRIVGDIRIDI